jgi:hypothetical protein
LTLLLQAQPHEQSLAVEFTIAANSFVFSAITLERQVCFKSKLSIFDNFKKLKINNIKK